MFRQKILRDKLHVDKIETASLRFLKLLWLLSSGSQDLMFHAWEAQHKLNENFCNTEFLDLPMVLQVVREQLDPSFPAYEKEAKFLADPSIGPQRKEWLQIWKFYLEWKLAKAVVDKNVTHGVSVPQDWMLETHASNISGNHERIPEFMRDMSKKWWDAKSHNARKIWLSRWRQAWGMKCGTLQPRGYLLPSDVQKKACPFQKSIPSAVLKFMLSFSSVNEKIQK